MALWRRGRVTGTQMFPGFADVSEIGTGSLATVYRAREVDTNRLVALKVLNVRDASPRALESFQRESIALGALSAHPNIVTLFRTFPIPDGRPVLVLELCSYAVSERLVGGARLPVQDAVSIAIKIAGALETAHRAEILHRDVKPQNILITEFGEPALADFGVAMLQSSTQTTAGLFDFTTLHAAPELLEGNATSAATDVYELASTLYQLIAGESAFRSYDGESPASVILRILRDPVQPVVAEGVPVTLSDLLIWAMSKDKEHRPPTAAQFAAELSQIEIAQGWPRTQFLFRDAGHGTAAGAGAPATIIRLPDRPLVLPRARSPVAGSPVAGSPVAVSPVAVSPVAGSPVAGSPVAGSPVAGSPVAGSPVAGSPVAAPSTEPPVLAPAVPAPPQPAAPEPVISTPPVVPDSPWAPRPGGVPEGLIRPVVPTPSVSGAPAAPTPYPLRPPRAPLPMSGLPGRSGWAEPPLPPLAAPPEVLPVAPVLPGQPAAAEGPVPAVPPAATEERLLPPATTEEPSSEPEPVAHPEASHVSYPIPPAALPVGPEPSLGHPAAALRMSRPAAGMPQFVGDLVIDPTSLRRRLRLHAGTTALTIDDRRLTLRVRAKRSRILWADVVGFEPQMDATDGDGYPRGSLVALTTLGPVELPATRGSLADVRYAHAMLDAYRIRAQLMQNG